MKLQHRDIAKGINVLIIVALTFFLSGVLKAEAATLSVGTAQGNPGDVVSAGVDLNGDGLENGMNFDINFDANKLDVQSVSIGAAAQSAQKTLNYSQPQSGVVRIIIFGLNRNVIPDGRVAELEFSIKATAEAGDAVLSLTNVVVSSPDAQKLPISTSNGKIVILGSTPDATFQGIPLNFFTNSFPESGNVVLTLNSIPAGTMAIELVMTVSDADFSDEGRLFINGQGPISLFGSQGVDSNDSISVTLDPISTDVAWYQLGQNTLTFWHDSTQGYVIEDISVNFTTQAPDTTVPQIISPPTVTGKTNTTATIEWTTDEPSNSLVQYGTGSSAWGSYPSSKNDTAIVTSHSVTITGLNGSTTYYFRVGSTDSAGNGPTTSNEVSFTTDPDPDTTAPSIVQYPKINHLNGTIDITYSESGMKNATDEANYSFSPTLLFKSLGGSDDIDSTGINTYRLAMTSIPNQTILTLTVSNITDQAGNPVTPRSITINDGDNDGMADDWEVVVGVSNPNDDPDADGLTNYEEFDLGTEPKNSDSDQDLMPDGWEADNNLDPLTNDGSEDADNDGFTNYEEYQSGSNPNDDSSLPEITPPVIKRVIPRDLSGIINGKRVHSDTSFAVQILDNDGIDVTDPDSVIFKIFVESLDPDTQVLEIQEYERTLDNSDVVRVVKLSSNPDTEVAKLWVAYDRSNDPEFGNAYPFGAMVFVDVYVRDNQGTEMDPASYQFKIETEEQNQTGKGKRPKVDKSIEADTTTLTVVSGDALNGTRLRYMTDEPVTPVVEASDEVPAVNLPGVEPVNLPVNLGPPTVFNDSVTLSIPFDGEEDIRDLNLYLFDGHEWVYAVSSINSGSEVQPGGEGWIVSGSLRENDDSSTPTLEFEVHHFSSVQAGYGPENSTESDDSGNNTDINADVGGNMTNSSGDDSPSAGGGCFIATAEFGSNNDDHVGLLFGLMFILVVVMLLGARRFTQ